MTLRITTRLYRVLFIIMLLLTGSSLFSVIANAKGIAPDLLIRSLKLEENPLQTEFSFYYQNKGGTLISDDVSIYVYAPEILGDPILYSENANNGSQIYNKPSPGVYKINVSDFEYKLVSGEYHKLTIKFINPSLIPPTQPDMQIGVVIDRENLIPESNEKNNIKKIFLPSEEFVTVGKIGITMRSNDIFYKDEKFIVAGDGVFAGKLRIKVQDEDALLQQIPVSIMPEKFGDEKNIQSLCLYDAPELSEEHVLGCVDDVSPHGQYLFTNLEYTLGVGNHDFYLWAQTLPTNEADSFFPGSTSGANFRFFISDEKMVNEEIIIKGLNSGQLYDYPNNNGIWDKKEIAFDKNLNSNSFGNYDELIDTGGTTPTSLHTIYGSKITKIDFVSSYAGETVASTVAGTGEYTLGILKIQTAVHQNRDINGDDLKLALNRLIIGIDTSEGLALSNMSLKRIGGITSTIDVVPTGGSAIFDHMLDQFGPQYYGYSDAIFESGEAAYFVIRGTVSQINPEVQDWIQISMNNLDHTSPNGQASIDWSDGYFPDYPKDSLVQGLDLNKNYISSSMIKESL